jgi:hypothetical protein
MLRENLKYNQTGAFAISHNIHKIQELNQITYWVGDFDATHVSIIVDIEVLNQFCKILFSTKNPEIPQGSAPFASDLYLAISDNISPKHLVLSSGNIISNDAERLWQGLVKRGHPVSVYDTTSKKYILSRVSDFQTLSDYIGDENKQRYVFVLSESQSCQQGAIHSVTLMELKRNIGWPLDKIFETYKHDPDYMCPNCVTPWKCNGPHTPA